MITVACVRVGSKYPIEYVRKLRSMVDRHLTTSHRFVCLTDQTASIDGVTNVDVTKYRLPVWWSKMLLFNWTIRGPHPTIYFDLDTVIVGDLSPLVEVAQKQNFTICANFHRLRGNRNWCHYGSCVMTFGPNWGGDVWSSFSYDSAGVMKRCGNRGDQKAIEELIGVNATILQDSLPKDFFLHYKDLPKRPEGTRVVVFGGKTTPANCTSWPRKEWR